MIKKVKLSDICIRNGLQTGPFGSQLKADEYIKNGIPVVMPKDIVEGQIDTTHVSMISLEKSKILKKHILETGDIVFSRRGDLSKIAVVSKKEHGYICGTGCLRARLKRDYYADYLRHVFQMHDVSVWLERNAVGQTMANLNTEILGALPLPLPDSKTQKKIAHILNNFDKSNYYLNQSYKLKLKFRKAIMQLLLTGKRRFPEFNHAWTAYRIGDIVQSVSRAVKKPSESYDAIGIRSHCKGTFSKRVEDPEKVAMEELYVAKTNDLILNITFGWEGAIAIVPDEHDNYLVSHRFPTYTAKPEYLSTDYLRYLVIQPHFIHMLGVISPGGAGRNRVLSKKDFLKLEVNIPDLAEQTRIADLLRKIDTEINLLDQQLNAYKEQKKGLMQKLLTGKIRLKVTQASLSSKNDVLPDEALA